MNSHQVPRVNALSTAHCCVLHGELLPRMTRRIRAAESALRGAQDRLDELRLAVEELGEECPAAEVAEEAAQAGSVRRAAAGLTVRETEVLQRLVEGLPNKAIARSLSASERTVKNHLRSIFLKLGASSRTEAALIAVASGLVDTSRSPVAAPSPLRKCP